MYVCIYMHIYIYMYIYMYMYAYTFASTSYEYELCKTGGHRPRALTTRAMPEAGGLAEEPLVQCEGITKAPLGTLTALPSGFHIYF